MRSCQAAWLAGGLVAAGSATTRSRGKPEDRVARAGLRIRAGQSAGDVGKPMGVFELHESGIRRRIRFLDPHNLGVAAEAGPVVCVNLGCHEREYPRLPLV